MENLKYSKSKKPMFYVIFGILITVFLSGLVFGPEVSGVSDNTASSKGGNYMFKTTASEKDKDGGTLTAEFNAEVSRQEQSGSVLPINLPPVAGEGGVLDRIANNIERYYMSQNTAKACKATAIGMMLNMLYGAREPGREQMLNFDNYSDFMLQDGTKAKLVNPDSFLAKPLERYGAAIDGKEYSYDYCYDTGKNKDGKKIEKNQLKDEIETAINIKRVPIVVETRTNTKNPESQHWVLIYGLEYDEEKDRNVYSVFDPNSRFGITTWYGDDKIGTGPDSNRSNPTDRNGYVCVV